MVGSRDVLIVAPLAALLGVTAGTFLGPDHGLLPGPDGRRPEPARRGVPGAAGHPRRAADAGRPRARRRSSWSSSSASCSRRSSPGRSARRCSRSGSSTTSRRPSSAGRPGFFILSREIFPNVLGPTVVEMTVRFGYAIFTVATLSFLGVGLQPPSPDWGLSVIRGIHEHDRRDLVVHALPRSRHRQHGHRGQPHRGLAPVGAQRMTTDSRPRRPRAEPDGRRAARRGPVAFVHRPRHPAAGPARRHVRGPARRVVRPRRRIRLRQVDDRLRRGPLPATQRRSSPAGGSWSAATT